MIAANEDIDRRRYPLDPDATSARPSYPTPYRSGRRTAGRRVRGNLLARDDRTLHGGVPGAPRGGAHQRLRPGAGTPIRERAPEGIGPGGGEARQGAAGGAVRVRAQRRPQPDGGRPGQAAPRSQTFRELREPTAIPPVAVFVGAG